VKAHIGAFSANNSSGFSVFGFLIQLEFLEVKDVGSNKFNQRINWMC
jgi:hypothetical protein